MTGSLEVNDLAIDAYYLHDSLDVNNLAIDAYYLHGSLSRRE
jgi:hypothetical protein